MSILRERDRLGVGEEQPSSTGKKRERRLNEEVKTLRESGVGQADAYAILAGDARKREDLGSP